MQSPSGTAAARTFRNNVSYSKFLTLVVGWKQYPLTSSGKDAAAQDLDVDQEVVSGRLHLDRRRKGVPSIVVQSRETRSHDAQVDICYRPNVTTACPNLLTCDICSILEAYSWTNTLKPDCQEITAIVGWLIVADEAIRWKTQWSAFKAVARNVEHCLHEIVDIGGV
jgi:hypothetical protein